MRRDIRTHDVRLPLRPFFYTLDQIATLTAMEVHQVRRMCYVAERGDTGVRPKDKLYTINMAPAGEQPDWRVEEKEFVRWLRHRGLSVLTRWQ